jgi:hypothetical protein
MSDEETLHAALKNSAEMKDEGNAFFKAKNWTSAITAYNQALACLPLHVPVVVTLHDPEDGGVQRSKDQGRTPNGEDATQVPNRNTENYEGEDQKEGRPNTSKQPLSEPPSHKTTPLQEACSHARVVLHSNIAACELKLVRLLSQTSLRTHEFRCHRKHGKPQSGLRPLRSRKILIITRLFGGEQKPMKLSTPGLPSHLHKKVRTTPRCLHGMLSSRLYPQIITL